MRLIDADALIDSLGISDRDIYCKYLIEDAPTIEPERKKGKWVEINEDWRGQIWWWQCSECGYDMDDRYNFCPECGAKMDGGSE